MGFQSLENPTLVNPPVPQADVCDTMSMKLTTSPITSRTEPEAPTVQPPPSVVPAAVTKAPEAAPRMGTDMFASLKIRPGPLDILWHHALGYMPDFLNGKNGRVGWVRWSHRGVQELSKFKIPRKQKTYIMSPNFDVRFNVSFEEVLRECASTSRKVMAQGYGDTWCTEDLIQGMIKLNKMGYAHSYECWMGGRLVGGTFGIQLGGLVTMSSLFHRVSNASKAAYSRSMMQLRDRGFKYIDIGMVPKHHVDFGSDWMPRWKFESMLPEMVHQKVSIDDAFPCQPVPWQIRVGMPLVRAMRAAQRRLPGNCAA